MQLFKKLAIAALVLLTPALASAWGNEGHRISGQIADSYLTPKARAAIKKILGNESIALASNWADFIKSDDNYKYLSSWHYVDFDRPMSQPEMVEFLEHDNNTDAYVKLKFLITELKKKDLSQSNKLLYLRMLIHITEDLHQPMHTAHSSDKGGNDVKLNWFGKPTNLHSVWDSELIDFQGLSYTEYTAAINHTTPEQRAQLQKAPITQWIFESSQLAEKIYADTKPDSNLNYTYNFKYIATINQQLLKGGVRLAGVLNEIFG
ncbi:MAG: S1/P1 nuclease [Mucilaginibacter sp.]